MPALQLKDCPPDVYDTLRICANNEDRSIAQQTLHILRNYLDLYNQVRGTTNPDSVIFNPNLAACHINEETRLKIRTEQRRKLFEKISLLEPIELSEDFQDTAEMIRQERESRMDRIIPELAGK
ncbi:MULTISPECIES: hypothetical protein [unclassified Adlercreutzia]|uniref:hypothetical protein n=1 Tax=unclassified Adlercreutzia TaxID=2636013 RepID=UPI0013ED6CB8|nr:MULTISPECIES: hypothetical protein [unclassified Adlercreutzia]